MSGLPGGRPDSGAWTEGERLRGRGPGLSFGDVGNDGCWGPLGAVRVRCASRFVRAAESPAGVVNLPRASEAPAASPWRGARAL